ncbi:MAG: TetR/AcrR family transcriptional regulator [Devosia sp.]
MNDVSESRTSIKRQALDLLVTHGYRGMSFADLASSLGITRANVHYHFGSKAKLIDEVLTDYVDATLRRLEQIWTSDDTPFRDKLSAMLEHSRARYRVFNRTGHTPRPWSLISRLRQDEDMLTQSGRAQLRRFTAELHRLFDESAQHAHASGEFRTETTPSAIAILLVAIVDNAASITMADNSFGGLEAAYQALEVLAFPSRADLTSR